MNYRRMINEGIAWVVEEQSSKTSRRHCGGQNWATVCRTSGNIKAVKEDKWKKTKSKC